MAEDRPPFLFVKIWSIKNEAANPGFASITYDVRDVGEVLMRDAVLVFPEQVSNDPCAAYYLLAAYYLSLL